MRFGILDYSLYIVAGALLIVSIIYYFVNLSKCKEDHEFCLNHKQNYPSFNKFELSTFKNDPSKTLKEIANNLSAEFVFLISKDGVFPYIKPGEKFNLTKSMINELMQKTTTDEAHTDNEDEISDQLKTNKIKALINVAVGSPATDTRLVICTNKKINKNLSKNLDGEAKNKAQYSLKQKQLAMVMGKALPIDEVKEIIKKKTEI